MIGRLGRGMYDAREIADLLGEHPDRVIRWANTDASGRPPAFDASLDGFFSFLDLVAAAVVAELRRRGIRDSIVRVGVEALRLEFGEAQPLVHRQIVERLGTAGTSFVARLDGGWYDLGQGGQGAFEEVIRLFLETIAYDDLGVALKWEPAPLISLDPKVQAGAPCVNGTRVTTRAIADMAVVDSVDSIADDLDLESEAVRAAISFQNRLDSHEGVAA